MKQDYPLKGNSPYYRLHDVNQRYEDHVIRIEYLIHSVIYIYFFFLQRDVS